MQGTSEIRRTRLTATHVLWVLVVVAVSLRLAAAVYQGNRVEALPGIADQISYHQLALRVLQGHGFSFAVGWWPATPAGEPTAHWSFLYVLYLAAVYLVSGPNPVVPRLLQAVATGVLQVLLTWRVGRRLFGDKAGLISAGLAAFNAYFVYYSSALMTEAAYIVALLWMVDIATSMDDPAAHCRGPVPAKTWMLLGLAIGLAALLRQMILLLAPVVIGWAVWRCTRQAAATGQAVRPAALYYARSAILAVAVAGVLILPWTIRNYAVFDRFVLLNTNAGFAFFWANHPIHGTHFIPLLQAEHPTYGELIPPELRSLNEGELDAALMRRGLGFVAADPVRYLRLSGTRVREFFRFWPSRGSGALSNYARTLSFGLFLPFLAAGVVLALTARRLLPGYRPENGPAVYFVLLLAALYTLIHLLSWTLIRYRLPVDAITLPFSGAALTMVLEKAALALGAGLNRGGKPECLY